MTKQPKKEKKKFLVELPIYLVNKIQREAEKERRSRNAQIVRAFEERYSNKPTEQPA